MNPDAILGAFGGLMAVGIYYLAKWMVKVTK